MHKQAHIIITQIKKQHEAGVIFNLHFIDEELEA